MHGDCLGDLFAGVARGGGGVDPAGVWMVTEYKKFPEVDIEHLQKELFGKWCFDESKLGADPMVLAHPEIVAGMRTAAGHLMLMGQQIRVIADPLCPITTRRQFRFPRSKKKRVRKKWARDPRNWRDEWVVFMVNKDTFKLDFPKVNLSFT